MPNIEFQKIVKRYGAVPVLEELNLTVGDGEFLILLGPSGCGKTTLLNLLAGILGPTEGRIFIDGNDVTDLDPKDRGLAMVFQSYALYPTKTVRGNLKFGLLARKLSREEIDERINWAAQLLQIEPLLDRKPAELSGGQRQRVAIGRALVKRVDVCLFDEPLSNLDAKLRTEMRLEIKKLHQELRPTIVYVTHDQVEALTMATRIAVMNKGVIQQCDTPEEIYERPVNLFVAGFIGSPAMNFLNAEIRILAGTGPIAVHQSTGTAINLRNCQLSPVPLNGAKVVLGLRPEHFSFGQNPESEDRAVFAFELAQIEKIGSESTVYLNHPEGLLCARADSSAIPAGLSPGQTVQVSFPTRKLHVFDASTGRRL